MGVVGNPAIKMHCSLLAQETVKAAIEDYRASVG
jgi:NifU-like protein involved in Fe-S cluster formation